MEINIEQFLEYQKFIQKNLSPVEKEYLEAIKILEQTAKENS